MKFIKRFYLKYKVYFQNSFLYLFSSLFSAFLGLLVNPFMAKNLSPEDYAVMGYFNSFCIIILPIMNFSLITYYLRNYYKIAEDKRQKVVDTILIALGVYGFIILLISLGVFYMYSIINTLSFPIYPYVLLAFIPIYMSNFVTLYLAKCRLERLAMKYSKITIYSAILSTILAVLLVVIFKYGATGRMMATLIAGVFPALYCIKQLYGKFQFDFEVIKDALRFGWPLSLSAILWYFLSGVDLAMLEKLNDSYTLGFYNVGLQISSYFAIFYTAIAQTFEPDIYTVIADNNKSKLIKIIGGVITLNAIPNLLFIVFAPLIIGLLTFNRYVDASDFARILALKNITITFYYSLITVIVGYGFTKSELMIRLIGALLSFIMFKILIANYGFYGAAWGQVFSFLLLFIIGSIFLINKFKINTDNGSN